MRRAIILLCGLILAVGVSLAIEQHPYRGGKRRFERYFGPILPPTTELERLSIAKGSFWDEPRFRFHLRPEEFTRFSHSVKREGFSDWEEHGGQYGSFNEESRTGDKLRYSFKYDGRRKLMLFYRPSTGAVDAVTFRH